MFAQLLLTTLLKISFDAEAMSSSGVGSNWFARRNNVLWRMNEASVNRPSSQLRFKLREHFCNPSLFAQDVSETYSVRTHSPVEFRLYATSLPQTRICDLSSPPVFLLICLDRGKTDGKKTQNGNGVACVRS